MIESDVCETPLVEGKPHHPDSIAGALQMWNLAGMVLVVDDLVDAPDSIFCVGARSGRGVDSPPEVKLHDLEPTRSVEFEFLCGEESDERTHLILVFMLASSKQGNDLVESYRPVADRFRVRPVVNTGFLKAVTDHNPNWLFIDQPQSEQVKDEEPLPFPGITCSRMRTDRRLET